MNKILFKEEQQFRQWWQIVLRLVATVPAMIICIYTLYQQNVAGVQVGDGWAPNAILIMAIVGLGIGLWVTFSIKLEVMIDQDGIHYRFFPLIPVTLSPGCNLAFSAGEPAETSSITNGKRTEIKSASWDASTFCAKSTGNVKSIS